MGMEKIPVSFPAVPRWRNDRCTSEHHLVDHELSVIFADRSIRFLESRIREVRRIGPFPTKAPIELFARGFPFKFGRQTQTFPFGERRGLVVRHMTDRSIGLDLSQTGKRVVVPAVIAKMPIERGIDPIL